MSDTLRYDENEARELLRARTDEIEGTYEERNAATTALFEQLNSLFQEYRFSTSYRGGQLLFISKDGNSFMLERGEYGEPVRRFEHPRRHDPLPLVFSPEVKRYVSNERDPRIVPTPGQEYPRRSALAVVVELVLKELAAPSTPA